MKNPKVMVQIGQPGDKGVMEIVEMLSPSKGPRQAPSWSSGTCTKVARDQVSFCGFGFVYTFECFQY